MGKNRKSLKDVPSKAKAVLERHVSNLKEVLGDPRFTEIGEDAQLRRYPKLSKKKVVVDDRFSSVFKDSQFGGKYSMDPRGRPSHLMKREDLSKVYHLEKDEEEESEEESTDEPCEREKQKKHTVSHLPEAESDEESSSEDHSDDSCFRASSGSDSSEDDFSLSTDEESAFEWGEVDRDAQKVGRVFKRMNQDTEKEGQHSDGEEYPCRLAVCNLDWENIKAEDLFFLFSSFLPPGGVLKKVAIYLSEFGRQKLDIENASGPFHLMDKGKDSADNSESFHDDVEDFGSQKRGLSAGKRSRMPKTDLEALRIYERNRLKYYYGVGDFDSGGTTRHVYEECNGVVFESSGLQMDLRYIPNDMEFDEEPKDVATSCPGKYQYKGFTNASLRETRPQATWDKTDPARFKAISSAMVQASQGDEIDEDDVKKYVASSSEEESSDNEDSARGNESDEDTKANGRKNMSKKGHTRIVEKFRNLISEIDKDDKEKNELKDLWNDSDDDDDTSRLQTREEMQRRKAGCTSAEATFGRRQMNWQISSEQSDEEEHVSTSDGEGVPLFSDDELPDDAQAVREMKKNEKKTKKKDIGLPQSLQSSKSGNENETFSDDELPEECLSFPEEGKKKKNRQPKVRKHHQPGMMSPDDGCSLFTGNDHREDGQQSAQEERQKKERRKAKHLPYAEDTPQDKCNEESLALLVYDSEEDKHFSIREIAKQQQESTKKTKKKKTIDKYEDCKVDEDNFKVSVVDPRFSSLFASGDFHIDPSNSAFIKTKNMEYIISQIHKRRRADTFEFQAALQK